MKNKSEILDFVLKEIEKRGPLPGKEPEENLSYRFFDHGHIDSFGIVVFVTKIEDHFGVSLGPEELQSEEFRTVGGVVNIVHRLIKEK